MDLGDLPAGWYEESRSASGDLDYAKRVFKPTTQSGPTLFEAQLWINSTSEGARARYDSDKDTIGVSVTEGVVLDGTHPGIVSFLAFTRGVDAIVRPQVYLQAGNVVTMVGYEGGTSQDAIDAGNLAAAKLIEALTAIQ